MHYLFDSFIFDLFFSTSVVSYEIFNGVLDEDDILLKAKVVEIQDTKIYNGLLEIEATPISEETFDYDIQLKTKTDVILARMIRLFEFVTLETSYLPDQFQPLEEEVDEKNSLKILEIKRCINEKEGVYELNCPYSHGGICVAKLDENLVKDGKMNHNTTITMLSNWKRKDWFPEEVLKNQTFLDSMNYTAEVLDQYLTMDSVVGWVNSKAIKIIDGNFVKGKLEGLVKIEYVDGTILQGLAKNNTFHGVSR